MHDVCVIGHVTKDVRRLEGSPGKEAPGGVAYYATVACRRLGLDTAVISKAASDDADAVMGKLRQIGAETCCLASEVTTVFENVYAGDDLEFREQKVLSVATAFEPRDLGKVAARTFHLGPLTESEMSAGFLKAVYERGGRVFLDVQGFLRRIENGRVRFMDWPGKREALAYVDVLKADLSEARILSGEEDPGRAARRLAELGPEEVIVTCGAGGSLIFAGGRLYPIPAYPPRTVGDPTGCGDSYSAGYIYCRQRSDDIGAAGRFAAALATLKLERHGPFTGNAREVQAFLEEADRSGSRHGKNDAAPAHRRRQAPRRTGRRETKFLRASENGAG